jgi:hypothetical protein
MLMIAFSFLRGASVCRLTIVMYIFAENLKDEVVVCCSCCA